MFVTDATINEVAEARYAIVRKWIGDSNDRLRDARVLISLSRDYDSALDSLSDSLSASLSYHYDIPRDAIAVEWEYDRVTVSGYMATDTTAMLDDEYARLSTMTIRDAFELERAGFIHIPQHARLDNFRVAVAEALDDASSESMMYVYAEYTVDSVHDSLSDAIAEYNSAWLIHIVA